MPKVTIAVAVYNNEKYIEATVRSLYEQTMDDLEILLVDDCTPDDSINIAMRILEEYPQRKEQVRVIRHEQNMGIAKTKKDGYLLATGGYIAVIDGDDYIDTRYAELLYQAAIEKNADMAICDFYVCNTTHKNIFSLVPNGIIGDGENVREDMLNRFVYQYLWCKLIRKDIITSNDIMWPQNGIGEDSLLSPEFAYYCTRYAYVKEPLYYYLVHQDSISQLGQKSEGQILDIFNSYVSNLEILIRFYQRENISEKHGVALFINKLRAKNRFRFLIEKREYRKMWFTTYPEINKTLLFGSSYYKPSWRNWCWFFSLAIGLPVSDKLRKHILGCVPKYGSTV